MSLHYVSNFLKFWKIYEKTVPTYEGKFSVFEKWKVFWFCKNGQKKCPKMTFQKTPYWPIFSKMSLDLYGLKRDYKKIFCYWKFLYFFVEKYLGTFYIGFI
jgi:hypothetical protein